MPRPSSTCTGIDRGIDPAVSPRYHRPAAPSETRRDRITATEERIARNEALFREVNEHVSAVSERLEGDGKINFLCECADGSCKEAISLHRALYESVRSDPRQFVVVRGHEAPGAEIKLVEGERFAVVRKVGPAGQVAEATDPRRRD